MLRAFSPSLPWFTDVWVIHNSLQMESILFPIISGMYESPISACVSYGSPLSRWYTASVFGLGESMVPLSAPQAFARISWWPFHAWRAPSRTFCQHHTPLYCILPFCCLIWLRDPKYTGPGIAFLCAGCECGTIDGWLWFFFLLIPLVSIVHSCLVIISRDELLSCS